MANAIAKLFDSVLPHLQDQRAEPWPRTEDNIEEPPLFDGPPEDPDDVAEPFDEDARIRGVIEGIGGSDSISEKDRDLIEGGLRGRGMEVLAFYKSRRFINHFPFRGKWGIFYLRPGLDYVRQQLESTYPGIRQADELAMEFLRVHEHFHFRADVQTLMFEATLGRHLYMPLRVAMRGRSHHFVEEALANRQVWDWAKKGAIGIREFAEDFMKVQPGAYSRFDEPRLALAAEWVSVAVDLKPPGVGFRRDLAAWVEATPGDYKRASLCPEYVVRPGNLSRWISPVFQTPPVKSIVEGEKVQAALAGRYVQLQGPWDETKRKLQANRHLPGLRFKPWRQDGRGCYSVRVDDNVRAHLRHEQAGTWIAYAIGGHKDMGHG